MIASTVFALAFQATVACSCPAPVTSPVMGHRGSGISTKDNPVAENTLPSFERAIELGADYLETDVHLTRDGKVVLLHDSTLDKTTNLSGCVGSYDYAALATADATKGSAATEQVGVPLLSDVLVMAKSKGTRMNIEFKMSDGGTCPDTDIPALVSATVNEIKAAGMSGSVMFSSFNWGALVEAKSVDASIPVGFLTAEGGDILIQQAKDAKAAGFEAINPIYFVVSESLETLAAVKATGIRVIPWTVNDDEAMRKLFENGVDALITDDVASALKVRETVTPACSCQGPGVVNDETGCNTSNPAAVWPAYLFLGALLLARRAKRTRARR